ncbi:MAG: GatB/YqeY domain-containing protein [Candidatus Dormibacterales bacterium]
MTIAPVPHTSLYVRIQADLAGARRRRDEAALRALGLLKSELVNASKEPGASGEIEDGLVLRTLRREVKKREEAAAAFRSGGREGGARAEEEEAAVLRSYLPAQLDAPGLEAEVRRIVEELQPEGPGAFGAVMRAATSRLEGRAAGAEMAAVVRRLLGA